MVASSERRSAEFRCRPAPPPPPPCSSERRRRRGGGTAHVLHVRPERQTRHRECRWHQTMPRCTGQGTWQNVLPRLYTPTYNTRLQRSPLFPHSLSLSFPLFITQLHRREQTKQPSKQCQSPRQATTDYTQHGTSTAQRGIRLLLPLLLLLDAASPRFHFSLHKSMVSGCCRRCGGRGDGVGRNSDHNGVTSRQSTPSRLLVSDVFAISGLAQ